MIGLLFFGVIGLWIAFAIGLGIMLPKWLKLKWPAAVSVLLVPLIMFAPVADEVIAYPQFHSHCYLRLADGVTEQVAFGKKVLYVENKIQKKLLSGVLVEVRNSQLNDVTNGKTLLIGGAIKPLHTMLNFSVDGGTEIITAFLNTCPSDRNLDQYKRNHEYITQTLKMEFVKKEITN